MNNFKLKTIKFSLILVGFILFVNSANAQTISEINAESISHGDSIVISGSGFGTKDPAAPLMWDDAEDKGIGEFPSIIANTYSQVGYSHYQPGDIVEGEDIPENWEIHYRSVGFAPVSDSVDGPHSRSAKYISGGHWENNIGTHSGRDVSLTVATPSGFEERWFATWYYTIDPAWPSCGNSPNHKITTFQSGTVAYSNPPYTNQYFYMGFSLHPCNKYDYTGMQTMGHMSSSWCYEWYYNPSACNPTTPMGDGALWRGNSPSNANWIRLEQRVSNDQGFLHFLIDNHFVWKGEGRPNWVPEYTNVDSGIRSFTAGGYYRWYLDGAGFQHNDAFRFFDDIYIDSTLSRVMLGDNSNYDSCTILEPQIPSAWSDNSITVTTNLGALTGDIAYLFVFDADNNHDPIGYPVTLGSGGDTTPPFRANPQPTGALSAGTTQTAISLTTNETANCKYSTTAGVSYASMPNTFSATDSTTHSTTISGLQDDQTYNYYVRCNDSSGNFNTDDFAITFSISQYDNADINQDSQVNAQDIQLCVNVILGSETDPAIVSGADVNGNSGVNVLDVQEIANIILE